MSEYLNPMETISETTSPPPHAQTHVKASPTHKFIELPRLNPKPEIPIPKSYGRDKHQAFPPHSAIKAPPLPY